MVTIRYTSPKRESQKEKKDLIAFKKIRELLTRVRDNGYRNSIRLTVREDI